jgi:DNA-3-methyladenine glycosylase II
LGSEGWASRFWEGFAPAELATQQQAGALQTVFRVEGDWSLAEVHVTQQGSTASLTLLGDGGLDQAAAQACRFLSVDIDARAWPDIARLDPVIADAQRRLPGLRPCGFHSPYEAAAWAVLSQRLRIVQAARLRDDLVGRHAHDGAFPAPDLLRILDLDLPGHKAEYLRCGGPSAPGPRFTSAYCANNAPTKSADVQRPASLNRLAGRSRRGRLGRSEPRF